MANDTPYDRLQRLRDVAREFGKPVAAIPRGKALDGRVARIEGNGSGKFRAIVVGKHCVAVIGLNEDAQALVGKTVRLEHSEDFSRLVVSEQSLDRGR